MDTSGVDGQGVLMAPAPPPRSTLMGMVGGRA
jgi:hypothetical protein